MDSRERLARVLYEQWLLGEYPDTDLADPDWNWASIPQVQQVRLGHRKEYCRDFWLNRADAILSSDWLRDTLAAAADERQAAIVAAVRGNISHWRTYVTPYGAVIALTDWIESGEWRRA